MSIIHGDCLDVMADMDPESVDAIVTDPPYGLEFMGKEWDRLWTGGTGDWKVRPKGGKSPFQGARGPTYVAGATAQAWHQQWAEAAYRVAKPSAYLLAFGGTRTVHRMTVALEDAGWIIRDMLVWAYASGFPKSKASLKPAWEPIVMARKPGPLRDLAIDACRLPTPDNLNGGEFSSGGRTADLPGAIRNAKAAGMLAEGAGRKPGEYVQPAGRWPANVILTDPIFDGGVESVVGGGVAASGGSINGRPVTGYGGHWADSREFDGYGDSGTYSRFFLVPKSSRSDREPVITPEGHDKTKRFSTHPTQKPTELMRHLIRLVTPPGGLVLDPFGGSGTTALAGEMEGFPWILIERELEYVEIARARLNGTQRGLGLDLGGLASQESRPIDGIDPELLPRVAGTAEGDEVA